MRGAGQQLHVSLRRGNWQGRGGCSSMKQTAAFPLLWSRGDRAAWLLASWNTGLGGSSLSVRWSPLFPVSCGLLRAVFGGTSQWLGVTSVKFFLAPYAFSSGETTVECLEHSIPKPAHFILEAEMLQELPQGQRQRQDSNPELGAPGQAAEMFSKPTVAFPLCVHHSFSPCVWRYLVLLLHLGPGR